MIVRIALAVVVTILLAGLVWSAVGRPARRHMFPGDGFPHAL